MIVDSSSLSASVAEVSEDGKSSGAVTTISSSLDKENNKTAAPDTTTGKMGTSTTTKITTANSYAIPWVEKFRPRTLNDVLGNVETVIRLRAIAKDGNLPNLILCGPPGTGTCISLVVQVKCTACLCGFRCCIQDDCYRIIDMSFSYTLEFSRIY